MSQLRPASSCSLPPHLCDIVTPLKLEEWARNMLSHPDAIFTGIILAGLTGGFRIGFNHRCEPCRLHLFIGWGPWQRQQTCAKVHLGPNRHTPFPKLKLLQIGVPSGRERSGKERLGVGDWVVFWRFRLGSPSDGSVSGQFPWRCSPE